MLGIFYIVYDLYLCNECFADNVLWISFGSLFYFLVYIGAIMILFLFSVMILDLKNVTSERNFLDFLSFVYY